MDDDNGRRIYDIGRPAQPQPPTSKPIIVGHRPVMPDPMLRRDYRNLHPQKPEPLAAPTPIPPPQPVPLPQSPPAPVIQSPEPAPPPPETPRPGPPFAKYAPPSTRPVQMPADTDFLPPAPVPAREATPMPPEDLTLHIPAGKVSVWRSPLTWLGSALLVLAIAFLVFIALRLTGK